MINHEYTRNIVCPYCGGEVSIESFYNRESFNDFSGKRHRVSCTKCGIYIDGYLAELAIEAWNRREGDNAKN
jgi:DNA-directed RNA polymerase subunit RPC12/RpoP